MNAAAQDESDWLDLLAEFRRLGGVADNIRLGTGALGRGLFPVDPVRPVALRVPENLLLPIRHAKFRDGQFVVSADAPVGSAERAWLEHYENAFSWGAGGRADTENFLQGLHAMPLAVREKLARSFGMDIALRELSPELVEQRFLHARMISYGNSHVVMPLVEMVNHGQAPTYDFDGGVGVTGNFADEILVRYSDSDTLDFFLIWGFVCETAVAMSLPLTIPAGPLVIARDTDDGEVIEIAARSPFDFRLPRISSEGGKMRLSFLPLGLKGYPRIPKGAFRRVFRDAGMPANDELFELALFMNRTLFLELMRMLEDVEGAMARSLRTMCRMQLETLCYCIGVRDV